MALCSLNSIHIKHEYFAYNIKQIEKIKIEIWVSENHY